jgi:hypothetical protein
MSISLDSITWPNIDALNLDAATTGTGAGTGAAGTSAAGTGTSDAPPLNGPANIVGGTNFTIPLALVIIIIILVAYYVLFASLGSENVSASSSASSGSGRSTLELLLWGLFILLILLNGMSYIFSVDIIASVKNIFSPVTDISIKVNEQPSMEVLPIIPSLGKKDEVFHISDNKYNYADAKAICSAYNGRLASYNEINDAYNNGADWCGYGWSEGQMALFPTQEEKWNKLQTIDGHHHDCGRPGINGGFIDNPNVAFGINCYGPKPAITSEEAQNMSNQQLYPKTQSEIMLDKKTAYWRSRLPDILISPFNSDNWSII